MLWQRIDNEQTKGSLKFVKLNKAQLWFFQNRTKQKRSCLGWALLLLGAGGLGLARQSLGSFRT
jgi:hypothetical protein